MKLGEVFRFELAYQAGRAWPWLSMAVLGVFAFMTTRVGFVPVTLPQDFILNSPFTIATLTVFGCQIWLLVSPAVAGEAAARDLHTRMHPLVFTSPVRKTEYLGGRFLAALVLNALVLLAVQIGSLLAAYAPGVNPEIIGPFRPAAYLAAFGLIALPNALIGTTIQFTAALLSGRPVVGYLGSMILFFLSYPVTVALAFSPLARPDVAMMTDPIGVFAIMNVMMSDWTIVEKNVRMFTLDGMMLWNRLLWVGIALGTLAFVYAHFRFEHRTATDVWSRFTRRFAAVPSAITTRPARIALAVPQVPRSFGLATHLRQTLAITGSSFAMIAKSPAGLFILVAFPMALVLLMLVEMQHWGVPLLPRTDYVLTEFLTAPVTEPINYWVIVPLLTIYFAGELIFRERDAGLSENVDTTPVPDWVVLLGKLLGVALVLVVLMASLTAAGILLQLLRGYHYFQVVRYAQILFGLQLPEYLLFAVLAFTVQAVVSNRYLGQLAALVAYLLIVLSGVLGIHHNLLVYGASPAWSFTEMRGFGWSVRPWLWFKLYWVAWALLLAVVAKLLWVRGREPGFGTRLRIARGRFTRATAGGAVLAVGLILGLGGFVFYNTNVLNDYETDAASVERAAEYERRYGIYQDIPQPDRVGTTLAVDIYPDRGAATIRGSYRLINRDRVAIDSVHLEPASFVETSVTFDRAATQVIADEELGHSVYALERPLAPGDSLTLGFEVRFEPRGFRNSGASMAVVPNGSYFTGAALPAIGYQPRRELMSAEDRRTHGLPRQVTFPTPEDVAPDLGASAAGTFEAVVSTDEDQVAVAPGELRRSWSEAGRRYFHYASDVPVSGQHLFFSADYAVHQERWKDVEIQVFNHPTHTENLERILRSVRASLDYYSSQFGPYPYRFLQVVEQPANGLGMGVDGSGVVTGLEGFFRLNPRDEGLDAVFEIVAHEMAHQWWGVQLKYALAEGAIVLSESLAWYSGLQVVDNARGTEALHEFLSFMREPYPFPPIRTGLPLLRAMDPYAGYRKGPFALHALNEYVGEERVNGALRSLLEKKGSSQTTTLDLLRELQAVTPDSLQPLLHDLFEVNTFWELDADRATAVQTGTGTWQVTLDVRARKVLADSAGVETDVPVGEWVEIGIFERTTEGGELSAPLYLQKHRIRSGEQTITITVSGRPDLAGIDPFHLLDWEEKGDDNNIVAVEGGG